MNMACQEFVTLHIPCRECGGVVKLNVRAADYMEWSDKMRCRHVQDIFPYLTPAEREMFITQTCGSCWKKMFGMEGFYE